MIRAKVKGSSLDYSTFSSSNEPPPPSLDPQNHSSCWRVAVITMTILGALFTFGFFAFLTNPQSATADTCWRNSYCGAPNTASFSGVWDKYNYAPTTRSMSPASYFKTNTGAVSSYPATVTLSGNGDQVIYDFGKLTAGIVSVTYGATGSGQIGLAFTEAKNWTGPASDFSNGSGGADGAVFGTVTATSAASPATYTVPDAQLRGGFRYLTVFAQSSGSITLSIQSVTVEVSFTPEWSNPRSYLGYFYSNDDLLNRIWYAGAYTLQTNAVPASTGRHWPILGSGWANDMNMDLGTSETTIFVDGSKRDRTAWSGDLAIAVPSILVSLGDWNGTRNNLNVFLNDQLSTGELPFAGPAINIYGSDTYHMATLIGIYDYYLFTVDDWWLTNIAWSRYLAGMNFIINKIDNTGMLYVTGNNDWGRVNQGGRNSEANMLMYHTLTTGSQLATWHGDTASATKWAALAATLKTALNSMNYDSAAGAYKDTDTDGSIHPQDANSMALLWGINDPANNAAISTALTKNWNSIGAVAPELPNNIIGFGSSFEIKGHIVAGQATRALQLIRSSWGWYLNHPYGSASTCIEGYLADGTFGYRNTEGYPSYSYTSHAHGWSTGPTDALTTYILGLQLTGPAGKSWQLAPQFGDLTHAEGGFTTPIGKFSGAWTIVSSTSVSISWNAPSGTTGIFVYPGGGGTTSLPTATVDGALNKRDIQDFNSTTGVFTMELAPGEHTAVINLA